MPDLSQSGKAADRPANVASIPNIRARLDKRGTFEAAAAELTVVLLRLARARRLDGPQAADLAQGNTVWDAVVRAATLLRTRSQARRPCMPRLHSCACLGMWCAFGAAGTVHWTPCLQRTVSRHSPENTCQQKLANSAVHITGSFRSGTPHRRSGGRESCCFRQRRRRRQTRRGAPRRRNFCRPAKRTWRRAKRRRTARRTQRSIRFSEDICSRASSLQ